MKAKTLILGCSREAWEIAEELLEMDEDVILATPGGPADAMRLDGRHAGETSGRLEVLPVRGAVSCSASAGHYRLKFSANGAQVSRTVSRIVIADDAVRKPNFSFYGLSASAAVVSLSQAREFIDSGTGPATLISSGKRIAFITGLAKESTPLIAEEVMRCALKLQQEYNCRTFIFTGNLKVAGNGLEALYRQTKKAGTVYMKFTESLPDIHVDKGGRVVIAYTDEIIRETFTLNPDVTVIDETLQPSAFSRSLSTILKIHTGPDGFIQSDNVHRSTVFTNRKGIFAAGFSRSVQPKEERQADVGSAALAVLNFIRKPPETQTGKAEIKFTGHCVGCLTCFRICPYGAISLNPKVAVDPQACQGCGICAAECPRFAITMNVPAGETLSDKILNRKKENPAGGFKPAITAFCCSRSAKGAGDLASCMGYALPQGLQIVEVPCAGGISLEHLFSAFSRGADGVLVLTCHNGNCHSEYGNTHAHRRADQVVDSMPRLGFEPERLAYKTLAANMGSEFAETVNAFEMRLLEFGPSPMKPQA